MGTMIWNVKNASTVTQAVTNMRHNIDCTPSPQCVTRSKPFGHTIEARRRLRAALEFIKPLAADDYYLAHGIGDYDKACERWFSIQPRRGYVQLILK